MKNKKYKIKNMLYCKNTDVKKIKKNFRRGSAPSAYLPAGGTPVSLAGRRA